MVFYSLPGSSLGRSRGRASRVATGNKRQARQSLWTWVLGLGLVTQIQWLCLRCSTRSGRTYPRGIRNRVFCLGGAFSRSVFAKKPGLWRFLCVQDYFC